MSDQGWPQQPQGYQKSRSRRFSFEMLLAIPTSVTIDRPGAWKDGTVVRLADAIYSDGTFDRLPILADALEGSRVQRRRHPRSLPPVGTARWLDLLLGRVGHDRAGVGEVCPKGDAGSLRKVWTASCGYSVLAVTDVPGIMAEAHQSRHCLGERYADGQPWSRFSR